MLQGSNRALLAGISEEAKFLAESMTGAELCARVCVCLASSRLLVDGGMKTVGAAALQLKSVSPQGPQTLARVIGLFDTLPPTCAESLTCADGSSSAAASVEAAPADSGPTSSLTSRPRADPPTLTGEVKPRCAGTF